DQHDVPLGWFGYFRLGPRHAPRFARRCSQGDQSATRACRAAGRAGHHAPEYSAVQRGVLDHMRPAEFHCAGRRSRSVHPLAASARCESILRRGQQIRTPRIDASRGTTSQSTTILFFLMTSPQRCASSLMKAAISAGLLPMGSTLAARNLACTSVVLITSTAALATPEANAGDVFGGAATATQPVDTRPGKPASAGGGIPGSTGDRRGAGSDTTSSP